MGRTRLRPLGIYARRQVRRLGGLQDENGDADLALVLHPDYWRLGKHIYNEIVDRAFNPMSFESITIQLPPTRVRIKAIFRLGFQCYGDIDYDGIRFNRYRLYAPRSR